MNKKVHPITNWLNKDSKKKAPIYKLKNRDFDIYYFDNDKNLNSNDNQKIDELIELNKKINNCYDYNELIEDKNIEELEYEDDLIDDSHYVHIFKKKNGQRFIQYINQNSRRYHVNMLFNMILDYCKTNEIHDFKSNLLIGKKMRSEFVKFCYENRN